MFDVEKSLIKSLASEGINQSNEALDWYLERCNAMYVDIRLKDLSKLTSWNYDDKEIVHKNRAFFTIKGISYAPGTEILDKSGLDISINLFSVTSTSLLTISLLNSE